MLHKTIRSEILISRSHGQNQRNLVLSEVTSWWAICSFKKNFLGQIFEQFNLYSTNKQRKDFPGVSSMNQWWFHNLREANHGILFILNRVFFYDYSGIASKCHGFSYKYT